MSGAAPAARRRVVIVGRGAPERGGIPSFINMLLREGNQLGDQVEHLNLAPAERGQGGRPSSGNLMRTLGDARRLFAEVHRGDIVHLHSAFAPSVTAVRAGLLLGVARARGGRTVLHVHGGRLVGTTAGAVRRRLIRAALAPAHVVFAVATGVRDALLDTGIDPARVRLLRNGVASDQFEGEREEHDVPRVLFVGGLTPRKGVLDLVAASTSLAARGVRHELWLVGGVPDEGLPAYEEVLRQLPDHVVVFGALPPDAMPGTYARVDVFCLPSWWEAMPLTVLEAQAAGLPVVATDVGDVQDMVLAGRTGLLVPPRDPQALEAALGALLEHGDLRARMGREARIHVRENFAQGQLLHELARTFDHLRGTP